MFLVVLLGVVLCNVVTWLPVDEAPLFCATVSHTRDPMAHAELIRSDAAFPHTYSRVKPERMKASSSSWWPAWFDRMKARAWADSLHSVGLNTDDK